MLLSEYLQDNDLFGAVESVKEYAFITPRSNNLLSYKYGDRIMFAATSIITVAEIAAMLVDEYDAKWQALINTKMDEFNLGSDESDVQTVKVNNEVNRNNSNDTINKVSGYNSDDMIDDTGVNSNGSDVETGVKTTTTSQNKLNLKVLFENLSNYQKLDIISIVQKDVVNYLTLNIY